MDEQGRRVVAVVLKAASKADEDAAELLAGGMTSMEDAALISFGKASAGHLKRLCFKGYEVEGAKDAAGKVGPAVPVTVESPYLGLDEWSKKGRDIVDGFHNRLNGGASKKEVDEGFEAAQVV